MCPQVISGQYEMPEHFPDGAKDLIRRMLVVQPHNRISVQDIIGHPWFQVPLPRHTAVGLCLCGPPTLDFPRAGRGPFSGP